MRWSNADLVLVVDSDHASRMVVCTLCERVGYRTAGAGSGDEALDVVERELPAVVVTNIRLPGTSGYELCRELKERFGQNLPVVFVSEDRTEPLDIAAGLLIGADDYIVRPFHPDEFLGRLRRFIHPRTGREYGPGAELTPREREILGLLAEGFTQGEIAAQLSISSATVGTHIQHILGKLKVHSRTQAVALALRTGVITA